MSVENPLLHTMSDIERYNLEHPRIPGHPLAVGICGYIEKWGPVTDKEVILGGVKTGWIKLPPNLGSDQIGELIYAEILSLLESRSIGRPKPGYLQRLKSQSTFQFHYK